MTREQDPVRDLSRHSGGPDGSPSERRSTPLCSTKVDPDSSCPTLLSHISQGCGLDRSRNGSDDPRLEKKTSEGRE